MPDKYDSLKLENQICFPLCVCAKEIVKAYKPYLEAPDQKKAQTLHALLYEVINKLN